MAHRVEIYERDGKGNALDILDVAYVCGDNCHKDYCLNNNLPYEGWNGCAEIPEEYGNVVCANCKAVTL